MLSVPCSDNDVRALQVELRAARHQVAQRDESLARLVAHLSELQRAADAAVTAEARAAALDARLAALYSSRTFRWSSAARRAMPRVGAWRRHR